jgi:agmatine deiminase
MTWPAGSGDRDYDDFAREDALGLAELLSDHAPVTMLAHPEDVAECALRSPSAVSALAARHGGRPVGRLAPRWLVDGSDRVVAAMAGRDDLSRLIAEATGVAVMTPPVELDFSAMDCDGEGTVLACDRLAPGHSGGRAEAEAVLADWLGVERVIWCDEAGGHLPARFLAPGLVAVPLGRDERHPVHDVLAANRDRLAATLDAAGRLIKVVGLPCPKRAGGCYADALVAGKLVIVPVFEDRLDDEAVARLAGALPGSRPITFPATYLAPAAGGGLGMVVAVSPPE